MMDLFGDLPPPATASDVLCADVKNDSRDKHDCLKRPALDGFVNNSTSCKKPKEDVEYAVKTKGYLAERQGEREGMEDAHVIIDNIPNEMITPNHSLDQVAYYGVFDGHGGSRASKFAAEHLHRIIFKNLPKGGTPQFERDVRKCLTESFKKTDEEFLSLAVKSTPTWKDGSTAVILLILDTVVYSANLGDSRAYVCRRSKDNGDGKRIVCVPLTKDHNPTNFEERKRIEKLGGIVRDGRVMGVVEVSRSIGDGRFKHCGVISIPDIFKCQLTEEHMFLILACDGLWKVFSAQEAADFILNILEDNTIKSPKDDEAISSPEEHRDYKFENACNLLAVEAVKRGCTDNVTVMIVDLNYEFNTL